LIVVPTANVSNIVNAGNANITFELAGNTANFSGNVVALNTNAGNLLTANFANIASNVVTSNLTVNLELAGNTANFSGNIFAPAIVQNASGYDTRIELSSGAGIIQANAAGNITQFLPGGSMRLPSAGASDIIGGSFDGSKLTLNDTGAILSQSRGANVKIEVGTGGTIANTWDFNNNGNTTFPAAGAVNLGNLATANYFTGTFINGSSNIAIPSLNGNIDLTAGGNTSLVVTATGANITGDLGVTGNFNVNNLVANTLTANNSVEIGNTDIGWGTVTTSSISANQTIAQFAVAGVTGVEFLVKGIDASGSKYSMATITSVTDGSQADYVTFATAVLGGSTGSLVVNVTGGNLALQVTPASSNSTVWTAQYRTI
jgi:hypothetical protein